MKAHQGKFVFLKIIISGSSTGTETMVTAAVASVISILILVFVAVLAFLLYRRSRKTKVEEPIEEVDENPVYDVYYFADGDRVDYGNAEAKYENELYGT